MDQGWSFFEHKTITRYYSYLYLQLFNFVVLWNFVLKKLNKTKCQTIEQ